jgi:zinc protease
VTAEELDRARTRVLKDIDLTLNQSELVGLQLSEYIAKGDWRLFFLHRDQIKQVKIDDVRRVAGAYLKASNRTVGIFLPTGKPERAEIPQAQGADAMLRDYKGEAAVAAGEAFDPSPANIESRTTRSTLPGGLKLALLPKKTRGGTVVAAMTLRYGDEKALMNRETAAELAGGMLLRGTANHTRQQIKDEFDKHKARVSINGGATQATLSVETTRENLPAVLRLAAECLRESTFPDAEFETLRQETLADIETNKSQPQQIAVTAFRRHVSPFPKGDVRYTSTPDEAIADLKAATLPDVKKFYADFYGASAGEVTVVGDFDAKEIGGLAQQLFGGWKSRSAFTRVPNIYKDVPAAHTDFETPDKANAFFFAGVNIAVRDDDPEYAALTLGNYMLGGGFLNSRLAVRIRQKEGLSYGVGSQVQASSLDKSGTFTSFAIYAPQNAAKLEAAYREEIARVLKDGFEAKEIEEAKSGWLQGRQVARSQDAPLARMIGNSLYVNRTLAFDADFEKRVQALTAADIVTALRKHIDPAKISIFKAGDFAKAAAAPPAGK